MLDLASRVRTSCAATMGRAALVAIDHERLDSYELSIALPGSPGSPGSEASGAPSDESSSMLVLALDAINFGSGYHDVIRKRPDQSGAASMAARLTDYAASTGPLTADRLAGITTVDTSQIFEQELEGGALEELMRRFATALNDLGRFLADHHDGLALQLIDGANGSAVTLAESLTAMPFYRDVEQHLGAEVSFYKRAQITAADLARAGHHFDDLSRLTAFADNLVPHVLRVDNVLKYDEALAQQIDSGRRLEPGSQGEVEIRAAAVHAVELLAARTGHRPMDIDLALWERGGQPAFKAVRRHRARSVFY